MTEFMIQAKKRGFISKKESGMGFGFYRIAWQLRDNGILASNNVDDKNRKKWKLTKKGNEITEHLEAIEYHKKTINNLLAGVN